MPKGSRMQPSRFRWFIIFLLFAISVVNYIDRAAISYSIPQIERDLGLSPADAGGILGAFGLGYAITTLLGGIVVDRFGSRVVLAVAAVLWSVSIGATGLATGFVMLYAARVLLGVSEGPNFPALTGAVSRWLAPQERATALGNALVAVPLALAIGGPIVTQLLAWFDWRGTFFILFGLSTCGSRYGLSFTVTIRANRASSTKPSLPISKLREPLSSRRTTTANPAKTKMPSAFYSRARRYLPIIGRTSSTGTSCSSS
jgi:predicted MFS family arabinose efflux permease